MAGNEELRGKYVDELSEGMTAIFTKTVTEADIVLYAGISGDTNPVHLDEEFAKPTMFKGRIAHGMLTAGFISAVLGTKLPGPGSIYLSQSPEVQGAGARSATPCAPASPSRPSTRKRAAAPSQPPPMSAILW